MKFQVTCSPRVALRTDVVDIRFLSLIVYRLLLSALLFLCADAALAQRFITTVAGTDWIPPTDGRPASDFPFSTFISGSIASDSHGNIYLADYQNYVVVKLGQDGVAHIVAGNGISGFSGDGGPATNSSLVGPWGVAVDSKDNLYIADRLNHRIRKVTPAGLISTFAGTGANGFTGDGGLAVNATLSLLTGLAVDSSDNLLICDGNRIRRINAGGTIITIAGNGQPGDSGDGGPATTASLATPQSILVDAAGMIYIAEYGNAIRRINLDGTISTFAGNGRRGFSGDGALATATSFTDMTGMVFDEAGNLYVADAANCRIRMIAPSGIVTTIAGTGRCAFAGDGGAPLEASFYFPHGLAWDAAGRLIVSDAGNGRVRAITLGQKVETIAGNDLFRSATPGGPADQSYLFSPKGVAVDAAGSLYIADTARSRIQKVTPNGLIQVVAGTGIASNTNVGVNGASALAVGVAFPLGMLVMPGGDVLIANQNSHTVFRLSGSTIFRIAGISGSPGFSGDGGPATGAQLQFPSSLALDPSGNLYITDTSNYRVRKISSSGSISTFAGNGLARTSGDGGQAIAASLNDPRGIAVDTAGNVYIGEFGGRRIRKVTLDGRISTFAGTGIAGSTGDGGPATNATLGNVDQLAFDAQGNLYFSQWNVPKVRRIAPDGTITTVAGSGQSGFQGDGGPAVSASLNNPSGLAFGRDGTLYIADSGNDRIRAVITASPSYSVSATQLTFNVVQGDGPSSQQSLALGALLADKPFNGLPFTVITSSTPAGWLQVSSTRGTMPTGIGVSVDPSRLAPGTYQGVVQIVAPGATPAQTLITVTVNVAASNPPKISLDASQLNFSTQTGSAGTFRVLSIANVGGGTLNLTASASGSAGNWLSVSPASGSATAGSPLNVVVSVNPTGLASGVYTGKVVISSGQEQVTVPVSLSVAVPQPNVLLSQNGLTFTAVAQGGKPLPQTFGILNTGSGTMSWTAKASTLSGGPNWLSIGGTSGTVIRPFLDVSLVSVSIDPGGLAPGDYYGRVDVTASAINSPQTVTIVLNVLPPGSNPGPQVQPTGLIFTGVAGAGNPGSQNVTVSNVTSAPLTWGSSQTYVVPGNWLVNIPANATALPNGPTQMIVQPDFSTLTPGISRAFITLGFSDGSSRIVNVLSVVAPTGAGSSGKAGEKFAGGCSPAALQVLASNSQSTFSARVDQPVSIEAKVVDDCGTAVTPDRGGTAVTMRFSNGDSAVSMVHTGGGRWAGSWQPRNASTSDVRIAITAILSTADGRSSFGGQTFLNCTLTTGATVPWVDTGRILNGASFTAQGPVAPGTLITVFGSNLAGVQATSDNPLVTRLGDTQVVLGGRPVPLKYASDGQLNAQIPYDVAINTQLQLLVQRGTALSVGEAITVAAAQPAIFTVSQDGAGQGVIYHAGTNTVAGADAPAHAGEAVVIYCAGLGAVDPPVTSGEGAPADSVLSVVNGVSLNIGGRPAGVSRAILAPGLPGVYVVEAIVPDGLEATSAAAVSIAVAGQASPAVTMAVE